MSSLRLCVLFSARILLGGCIVNVIKPPTPLPARDGRPWVFLAGSIDMGQATDWQAEIGLSLQGFPGVLLNPRRDVWDSSWQQTIDNPAFRNQVEWELDGLAGADVIAMHLTDESKAPISLLELGLFAQSGRMVVSCGPRFWRRGNVEVVCARFGVPLVDDLEHLIASVINRLPR